MKIMHIAGSPRKNGSSIRLADRFLAQAENKGAEIRSYFLNQMDYQGCQGCYLCKTKSDRCALKDDLSKVLEQLYDVDLLLLSTPVYFGDVSGQMKCFIDRLFSLAKPDYLTNPDPVRLPKGKKLVFIQAQNADVSMHKEIFEKYLGFFKISGFQEACLIRACGGLSPDQVENDREIMRDVDHAVKQMLS